MVSRSMEANLDVNVQNAFQSLRNHFPSKIRFDRVDVGYLQVEGVKPEPSEAGRGLNWGRVDLLFVEHYKHAFPLG